MPNIATVLKTEIQRLARREVNQAIAPLKKSSASLRKTTSDQKQKIISLEHENKRLQQQIAKVKPATPGQPVENIRITGKNIKSLRKRLGITQEEFAKLVGSSIQIVPRWEKTRGRIKMRTPGFIKAIAELRTMKKSEVQDMLGHADAGKDIKKAPIKKPAAGYYQSSITAAMIKAARKKLGVSQAKFSELIGMSNQVVSKWESRTGKLLLKDKATEDRILEVIKG